MSTTEILLHKFSNGYSQTYAIHWRIDMDNASSIWTKLSITYARTIQRPLRRTAYRYFGPVLQKVLRFPLAVNAKSGKTIITWSCQEPFQGDSKVISDEITCARSRRVQKTLPYCYQLEPIDRIEVLVKNQVAHNAVVGETELSLRNRLLELFAGVTQKHLILVWKRSVATSREYRETPTKGKGKWETYNGNQAPVIQKGQNSELCNYFWNSVWSTEEKDIALQASWVYP